MNAATLTLLASENTDTNVTIELGNRNVLIIAWHVPTDDCWMWNVYTNSTDNFFGDRGRVFLSGRAGSKLAAVSAAFVELGTKDEAPLNETR